MKLLVVASEPISAQLLRRVAGDAAQDAEVLVIAPATTRSPLRFWVSDVDAAIARAEATQAETVQRLTEAGVDAVGDVGESEPLTAIEDALRTFPADRIVVFAHERGARDYREDDDLVAQARERFGLPVARGTVERT